MRPTWTVGGFPAGRGASARPRGLLGTGAGSAGEGALGVGPAVRRGEIMLGVGPAVRPREIAAVRRGVLDGDAGVDIGAACS
ncbi:hypothetical protein ACQP2X_08010 [Actinoplanes sp. CA-131856]